MLKEEFYRDLEIGKRGEKIVLDTFSKLSNEFTFVDVSGDCDFFYSRRY